MRDDLLREYEEGAANAAHKIYCVREGDVDASNAPPDLKALARANSFNGDAGALLANENGVLLGLGDGERCIHIRRRGRQTSRRKL